MVRAAGDHQCLAGLVRRRLGRLYQAVHFVSYLPIYGGTVAFDSLYDLQAAVCFLQAPTTLTLSKFDKLECFYDSQSRKNLKEARPGDPVVKEAMKRWLQALSGLAFAISFVRAGELEIVCEFQSLPRASWLTYS